MNKIIIEELNKLSKWIITKNISFIGHEWCNTNSLFTIMKINDTTIHIEIFFDDVNIESVVNCFKDKEHILSLFGTTEYCLKEVDKIKI